MLIELITITLMSLLFKVAEANQDYANHIRYGAVQHEIVVQEERLSAKEMVEVEFGRGHVMNRIAFCESSSQQFNEDGSVVKNPTSSAIGVFQVMESIHGQRAKDLNLDIRTTEGNIAYAIVLYNESGTVPWNSSSACWL